MSLSQAQKSERFHPSRFGYESAYGSIRKRGHSVHGSSETGSSSEDEDIFSRRSRKGSATTSSISRESALVWGLAAAFSLLLFAAYIILHPHVYHLAFERANALISAAKLKIPSYSLVQVESISLKEFVNRHMQEIIPVAAPRKDFALEAEGAAVTCSLTTACFPWPFSLWTSSPSLAITEGHRNGECWLVRDQRAQLGVVLSQPVYPSHVTIEHISAHDAPGRGEAPRSMVLWGLVDGENNMARFEKLRIGDDQEGISDSPLRRHADKFLPLASFVYDVTKSSSQTFAVHDYILSSGMDFTTVVLEIRSNWGSASTCLYRMRIHGEPVVAL